MHVRRGIENKSARLDLDNVNSSPNLTHCCCQHILNHSYAPKKLSIHSEFYNAAFPTLPYVQASKHIFQTLLSHQMSSLTVLKWKKPQNEPTPRRAPTIPADTWLKYKDVLCTRWKEMTLKKLRHYMKKTYDFAATYGIPKFSDLFIY